MRRIVWSVDAAREYREIIAYIAEDDPGAAAGVAARIRRSIEALADIPTGRKGRVTGTYEKIVIGLPYIVAYALGDAPAGGATLTVLRIIHGARDWPRNGWPDGQGDDVSLPQAAEFVRTMEERQTLKIACPQEIAYRMGSIDADQFHALAAPLHNSGYGEYLLQLLEED